MRNFNQITENQMLKEEKQEINFDLECRILSVSWQQQLRMKLLKWKIKFLQPLIRFFIYHSYHQVLEKI